MTNVINTNKPAVVDKVVGTVVSTVVDTVDGSAGLVLVDTGKVVVTSSVVTSAVVSSGDGDTLVVVD